MSTSSQTRFKRENLPDILRYIANGQSQGRLVVVNASAEAFIYFDAGQVIAARCGSLPGLDAIREVLLWDAGQFEFIPENIVVSSLPKVIWINQPLNTVLLEATKNVTLEDLVDFSQPQPVAVHRNLNVNSVPRLVQQNSNLQVEVNPTTIQLFVYLNGAHRIGHILQATGMTLTKLQSLLEPLLSSGFIELLDFPTAMPESDKRQAPIALRNAAKPISGAFIDELEQMLKNILGPFGAVLLEDAAENIDQDLSTLTTAHQQGWLNALKTLIPAERNQVFETQLEGLLKKHA
jgi:hypothetical protein